MLKLVTVVGKLATLLLVDKSTSVFESWWKNQQLVFESTIGGKNTKVCLNLQIGGKNTKGVKIPHFIKNFRVEVELKFESLGFHGNR